MSNNQSYLVLDTKDSTYSTANQNSTYTIDSTSAIACPNCFNTTWVLRRSLHNVSKIYLKSLMLPILFPNVRSSNKSNTITVVNNSTQATYTITLPDRTYTDITSLLTRINTAFLSAFPAINVVFALYTASDTTHCYNNVGVTIVNKRRTKKRIFNLPQSVTKFITAFDSFQHVEPQSFNIPLEV